MGWYPPCQAPQALLPTRLPHKWLDTEDAIAGRVAVDELGGRGTLDKSQASVQTARHSQST